MVSYDREIGIFFTYICGVVNGLGNKLNFNNVDVTNGLEFQRVL